MKYLLIPFAVIVHALMRYCEFGARFFGKLNDKYLDRFSNKLK